MASRAAARLRALGGAALGALRPRAARRPQRPQTILVLHELLLGDTLMLAALFAALRHHYPAAKLYCTAPPGMLPLFAGRPYGVVALPFSERSPNGLKDLAPAEGCDLALIPGENRHTLTARALGAQWIVALAGGRPAWKNWLADELVPFPERPTGLADLFALLAGPAAGLRYRAGDWPAPPFSPFDLPRRPYAVLHVGASTPLKYWPNERWRALAARLSARCEVVWSAGPKETALIQEIDPQAEHRSYAGKLDLAQLWHLVADASLVVTLDTGVAHLAKLTGSRTLALYGPGSDVLVGRGEFWRDAPFAEVTEPDVPCRDQRLLFRREIAWVRRCGRSRTECPRPRCMEAIALETVAQKAAA